MLVSLRSEAQIPDSEPGAARAGRFVWQHLKVCALSFLFQAGAVTYFIRSLLGFLYVDAPSGR